MQDDQVMVISVKQFNELVETANIQAKIIKDQDKRIRLLEIHLEELEAELEEGNAIGFP